MQGALDALRELGGSATTEELRQRVVQLLNLPDELVEKKHQTKRGEVARTHLDYELAWARTYLKQLGYVENSERGVWALTGKGAATALPELKATQMPDKPKDVEWQERLSQVLVERITPSGFERLIQRVLRETGFVQVEITGRSNDGGIDGRGLATINGILSFRVVFQCKRWKNSVGAPVVRDFRGAMQGRADKGLLITTSYFTQEAIREAARDGALAIDLVDGSKLIQKLYALRLGVNVTAVEIITIDETWFDNL